MWTDDIMRNESQINDYVNNGLSKNNLIGELDPLEMLRIEERLNCTESIIINPYFRNEAEKIRDKVKKKIFLDIFLQICFMQGLGPAGRGGFDEKKHLGRESKQGKAEKGWIWKETDQGITLYFCGDCLKCEKKIIGVLVSVAQSDQAKCQYY